MVKNKTQDLQFRHYLILSLKSKDRRWCREPPHEVQQLAHLAFPLCIMEIECCVLFDIVCVLYPSNVPVTWELVAAGQCATNLDKNLSLEKHFRPIFEIWILYCLALEKPILRFSKAIHLRETCIR